eukprot:352358-Chlamydomonas_euryale.AAC.2
MCRGRRSRPITPAEAAAGLRPRTCMHVNARGQRPATSAHVLCKDGPAKVSHAYSRTPHA